MVKVRKELGDLREMKSLQDLTEDQKTQIIREYSTFIRKIADDPQLQESITMTDMVDMWISISACAGEGHQWVGRLGCWGQETSLMPSSCYEMIRKCV
jgi:hypothetical protein